MATFNSFPVAAWRTQGWRESRAPAPLSILSQLLPHRSDQRAESSHHLSILSQLLRDDSRHQAEAALAFNSFPVAAFSEYFFLELCVAPPFNSFPVAAFILHESTPAAIRYGAGMSFNSFPVAAGGPPRRQTGRGGPPQVLSILSQLLRRRRAYALAVAAYIALSAFNSFPVAARKTPILTFFPFISRSNWLSILSQLLPHHSRLQQGAEASVRRFQFFPSCCRGPGKLAPYKPFFRELRSS